MVQEHPSKFQIETESPVYGDPHERGNTEFTFEEFTSLFDGNKGTINDKQLLAMIWADVEIAVGDEGYVKVSHMEQWMRGQQLTESQEFLDSPETDGCSECDALRERLIEANQKHDQLALLFADLVSKHNDLIEDHEQSAAEEEISHWKCSSELQHSLVKLHGKNKDQWRSNIVTMVQAYPAKFGILNVAKREDPDCLYSFGEFASYFKETEGSIHNEQLLRLMFDDMEKYDAKHVKLEHINQWLSTAPLIGAFHTDRNTEIEAYKSRVEILEQEKADLDAKLTTKTKELEFAIETYKELEAKYNELLEEADDEYVDSDKSKGSRKRRGGAWKKRLADEEAGGVCSFFPTFKDY